MIAPAPAKTKSAHKQPTHRQPTHNQPAHKQLVLKHAAKQPEKREPLKKERCARCGVTISSRRTPCVWHEHIVCAHCHGRLRAYEPAMAFCPGAKPALPYARGAAIPRPHGVGGWMSLMGRKLVSIF